MVYQESEVDVSTSNLSAEDNVAAETTFVETELSNHPVGMDVMQIEIVPQSEHKVETMLEELESESEEEKNVNEEEGTGEEHISEEEEEDADEKEENGADKEDISDELAAQEDDDSDGDEDEDDDVDYDYDDDDIDLDNDDTLMEEGGEIENKENDEFGDEDNNKSTTGEEGENKEKEHRSLAPKMMKVKNKNARNKVVNGELDKLTSKSEAKPEGGEQNGPIVREDEKNGKAGIEEKGQGSASKVKKLRKRNRRRVKQGNAEKMASKSEDKLELSGRKKTSKKAVSMGMIFMCSSKTKMDCYRYKVLGLPASKRDIVEKIYKGMRLFLYDVDLKLMYGIYKAAGPGGYNIEPKAFKSQFPSQVRFTVLEDCMPLAEEKFKKAIEENYFTRTKFDCQLKSEQVRKLCKLFVAVGKGSGSKRLAGGFKEKTHASRGRDRPRARKMDEEGRSALDEKHLYLDYPRIHQREVLASPPAPLYRIAPLHPPAAAPLYAYERTTETDAYRQNLLLEHRDSYRQPLLESRDAYRRGPYGQSLSDSRDAYRWGSRDVYSRDAYRRGPHGQSLLDSRDAYRQESRDVYPQDPVLDNRDSYRRDGVVEHRDLRPLKLEARHRDDIARNAPYMYTERQSYGDPFYIQTLSPERDHHLPVGRRYEYWPRQDPSTEYRSTRARYRY